MKIIPQDRPNNFEIGIAYQSMKRVKFFEFLLSIKQIASLKNVVSLIKEIVSEIKNSNTYAFWSHVKGKLPFRGKEEGVAYDAYDYTKTEKYKLSEDILFSMIGYDRAYNNPEITKAYLDVKEALTYKTSNEIEKLKSSLSKLDKADPKYEKKKREINKKIKSLEKVEKNRLKDLCLSTAFLKGETAIPEFVYEGKNYAVFDRNTFLQYQLFLKEYIKERGEYAVKGNFIYLGGKNALVETETPLFNEFTKSVLNLKQEINPEIHADLNKDKSNEEKLNKEAEPNKKEKETLDKVQEPKQENKQEKDLKPEKKSDKTKSSEIEKSDFKKISKNRERIVQEDIAKRISKDPSLLNGTECKINVINSIVKNKDDKFLYVKIPDVKLRGISLSKDNIDLKKCIVKIPVSYAKELPGNKGYEITLPMREEFKLLNEEGKNKLSKGKAVSVKGFELVKAFDIKEIRSVEKPIEKENFDFLLDGNQYKVDACDGFLYARSENDVRIINCSKKGEVLIPSHVEIDGKEYPVVAIETNAFENSKATVVKVPDTVRVIESNAFTNSKLLESISLPQSLIKIGNSAFRDCSSLKTVNISNTSNMGINPFEGCAQLKEIIVSPDNKNYVSNDGVLISKDGTLVSYPLGKENHENILIPDEVKRVGPSAFKEIKGVNAIVFPENCTEIGTSAFERADVSVVKLKTNENVSVLDRAFNDSSLKEFHTVSDTLEKCGKDAFLGTDLSMMPAKVHGYVSPEKEIESKTHKHEKKHIFKKEETIKKNVQKENKKKKVANKDLDCTLNL